MLQKQEPIHAARDDVLSWLLLLQAVFRSDKKTTP
jgi:hypothetical protein